MAKSIINSECGDPDTEMHKIINLFVFLALTIMSNYANAGSEYVDLHLEMKALKPLIKSTTIVFVADSRLFQVALNEKSLREVGCTYVAQEEPQIANLISILSNSNITVTEKDGRHWEKREAIFLTLKEGCSVEQPTNSAF